MRHLTDDIVLSVKDAVRNLRYAIRNEANLPLAAPGEARASHDRGILRDARRRNRMARLVDSVFTEVETGALALVSPRHGGGRGIGFPHSLEAYFGHGRAREDQAAERLFARSHYHAVKHLLRGFGLRNVLIFEHAIGRARDRVLKHDADLVTLLWRGPCALPLTDQARADRVRLCAAITCALVAERPIKEIDLAAHGPSTPRGLIASPNAYCFAVIGLATAIASINDPVELPAGPEIVESANAVVDVRFGRFAAALEAEDPVETLALEFDEVLPLLP